jgi:hypothetical protein
MDIPQWIKDFIAGTIEATPEIVAAFRQWSAMQNPVTLFASIGTNFLSQNLARQDFEAMYGSLPPEARYEAAQAEQSRIADLMMTPNLPQASYDAFEQQYAAAGEETTYAAINLGIYNGTINGSDPQSINNALFEQNRFYFGDYKDYGFNSPEEYFQAVIDDPFTNPPPEDVAWLFDTYNDEDGNQVLIYDHVVAASKDYAEAQAEAQAQYELEAKNRESMANNLELMDRMGTNPNIRSGIALLGDRNAIAAQLGMGAFRTSAQQNAGVLTPRQRGYTSYGYNALAIGEGSDGAATSDSYDYSVSTQPDLNVQRNLVPEGYQGPAGSFSVGAGSGNPLFGPNRNVASHGDPNPSRNLTSGNLPMSMAQLSSGISQSFDRDLAESKLPDMYFDLTDPDRMMMHLAAATYVGIPYDVAINQLIEHNQQYHPERFAQDQQSEDYDPFTLASDFLATATEDPNSQFNSPRATALAENLGQYTTSVSDIVEETRGAQVLTEAAPLESVPTFSSNDSTRVVDPIGSVGNSGGTEENLTSSNSSAGDSNMAVYTTDQILDRFNNSRGAQDFELTLEYNPDTGTFFSDLGTSRFGFPPGTIKEYSLEDLGVADGSSVVDTSKFISLIEAQELVDNAILGIDLPEDTVRSDQEITNIVNGIVGNLNIPGDTQISAEALNTAIGKYLTDNSYITNADLPVVTATTEQIAPDLSGFLTADDISEFITAGDLPDTSGFLTAGDLPPELDLSGYLTADDISEFITAGDLPAEIDTSGFLTAGDLPPELDLSGYLTADDISDVLREGDITLELLGGLTTEQVQALIDTGRLTTEDVTDLITANPQYTDEDIIKLAEGAGYTDAELDALFEAADLARDTIRNTVDNLGIDLGLLGDRVTNSEGELVSVNDLIVTAQGDIVDNAGNIVDLGVDLSDVTDRVSATEGDISGIQTDISGISGIVDQLQIDVTDVNGRIDLVEITFQSAVDALQAQHDAEIAIINDQLANDIPALQAALDALTLKQQEDVDALTIAYTAAIEAAQTETTEEFLGILEDYVTSENLTETLSDYVTNEGLAETLESYVNKIEDGYNQLLEDYGDLKDQLDQASSQYEVDALAIQMEEMRDKIDNYIDQTGYNPQTGTVTGGDGTGTGDGGPYSDNGDGTETGDGTGTTDSGTTPPGGGGGPYSDTPDDLDPNAGGGTTGGGTPPGGGPTGGGDNFEDTDPNAGGGTTGGPGPGGGGDGGPGPGPGPGGGGGEDWDPTWGRTYPLPQPGGGIGSGFLGNQYPPRQYQNQGYDPYTRPGPPAPLTGLTALTQPYNRPRQGEPVNPQYNPRYNYPYPYNGPDAVDGPELEEAQQFTNTQSTRRYNYGGQIQPITDMSMNDMLQNQGIGSLTNYETNVAPFQNAFRPNVRRYN